MDNLKVIENEVVPVYETSTGEKVVYGRELHEVLEVKSQYRDWIRNRISDIDAIENEDYEAAKILAPSGQQQTDHIIKLDIAKEMAMLERNDKGKQVRRYFIEIEKKYKAQQNRVMTVPEQIQIIAQGFVEMAEKLNIVNDDLQEFKTDVQEFKNDMPLLAVECEKITNAVRKKGVATLGGKESNAYNDKSLRNKLYSDLHREIQRQYGVTTYKALKRNQCEEVIKLINNYKPPIILAEQIEDCNNQQKFSA